MNHANKQPTWTSLITALLVGRDNFMTAEQIRKEISANCNQVSAALVHLRRRKAVDCIVEPDGIAWWFATPEQDDRTYHHDERCPECQPRRRRKGVVSDRKPKN